MAIAVNRVTFHQQDRVQRFNCMPQVLYFMLSEQDYCGMKFICIYLCCFLDTIRATSTTGQNTFYNNVLVM